MEITKHYVEDLKEEVRRGLVREGELRPSLKDILSELYEFRSSIYHPTWNICHYVRHEDPNDYKHIVYRYIKAGTFIKPVARLIAKFLTKQGYSVRLRGRGNRHDKYHNSNNDIRRKDALFLAIYADKQIK